MNSKQLLCALLFVFCSFLEAEPSNVLVGDLTFTRPTTWSWEAPDPKSPAVSCFTVPTRNSKNPAVVRFYKAGKEPEAATAIWKGYFAREDAGNLRRESKTIGTCTVSYIFLHGTLTMPGERTGLPGQALVGVVVPCGDKNLHIRFNGPKDAVDGAIPDLKTMVETAVQEREGETP